MNSKLKKIEVFAGIIFGIFGWLTFIYQYNISKPKIQGKILFAWHGILSSTDDRNPKLTIYTIYPILTNLGKKPIHILDYELYIDYGNGYKQLKRMYILDNIKNWDFGDLVIPNFLGNLIYTKNGILTHGKALHGFIVFASKDTLLNNVKTISYKLKCKDVFSNYHIIEQKSDDIKDWNIFFDLTGAHFNSQ